MIDRRTALGGIVSVGIAAYAGRAASAQSFETVNCGRPTRA
jgi:hypothetical protein